MLHILPWLCLCVCLLPRIQPHANLLQLSIADGETITCHLKMRESRKERRQEVKLLQEGSNCFHHKFKTLIYQQPSDTSNETWQLVVMRWLLMGEIIWICFKVHR